MPGRFRRRLGAVLVLVAALNLYSASPAAPATPGRLTLSGDASGYVDVVFTAPTAFDDEKAAIAGHGRYTGLVLDRLDRRASDPYYDFEYVWFRDAHIGTPAETGGALGLGHRGAPLPAGRYRIYLLTEGPGSISFPILEGASRTLSLRPVHRIHPRYRFTTIQQQVSPSQYGLYNGRAHFPVVVGPHDLHWVTIAASYSGPAMTQRLTTCRSRRPANDCYPPPSTSPLLPYVQTSPVGSAGMMESQSALRGLDDGPWDLLGQAPSLRPVAAHIAVLDKFLI